MFTNLKLEGYVVLNLLRGNGETWHYEGKNLVTAVGKALVASRLKDATDDAPSHMAVGSSTTAATEAQTALVGTEHERVAGTVTVVDNAWSMAATFGTGIASDVTCGEFGIFNDAVAGDMLCRFVTPEFTCGATDTIEVTWTVYMGGA